MDHAAQIEMLQQLVASQRANIAALEEKNARLQRQFERAKAAAESVDSADEPRKPKKRPAADSDAKNKKAAKPRSCKVCGEQILGFGCLKIACKAELARRKEAAQPNK